jgi:hypothetical protein
VIETNAYLKAAGDAGMTEEERSAVVDIIASDPEAGAIMPGCGGARKLRVRRPSTRQLLLRRLLQRDHSELAEAHSRQLGGYRDLGMDGGVDAQEDIP